MALSRRRIGAFCFCCPQPLCARRAVQEWWGEICQSLRAGGFGHGFPGAVGQNLVGQAGSASPELFLL